MNAHQIQQLSQLFNPLLAVILIVLAVRELKKSALLWIVCVAGTVGAAQQISKVIQHARWVNDNFPSTHFAVALGLTGALWALNRRFVPATAIFLAVYAVLILWRNYHTPIELVGALYALPMGYGAGHFGTRRLKIASNNP
jgi:hypothetical protein